VRGVAVRLPRATASSTRRLEQRAEQRPGRAALRECARVTHPGGRLAFTMNLPDTMQKFYDAIKETLAARGLDAMRPAVTVYIRVRRPSVEDVEDAVSSAGFEIEGCRLDGFTLRFASAATLFSHWLIRIGFLEAWREILPAADREAVFASSLGGWTQRPRPGGPAPGRPLRLLDGGRRRGPGLFRSGWRTPR
jgi:hypothetical protein